jgi:ribosomal protein S12 methylthiotransferase accessory factor YcaO
MPRIDQLQALVIPFVQAVRPSASGLVTISYKGKGGG